jgi:hypothetical protein
MSRSSLVKLQDVANRRFPTSSPSDSPSRYLAHRSIRYILSRSNLIQIQSLSFHTIAEIISFISCFLFDLSIKPVSKLISYFIHNCLNNIVIPVVYTSQLVYSLRPCSHTCIQTTLITQLSVSALTHLPTRWNRPENFSEDTISFSDHTALLSNAQYFSGLLVFLDFSIVRYSRD